MTTHYSLAARYTALTQLVLPMLFKKLCDVMHVTMQSICSSNRQKSYMQSLSIV